MLSSIDLDLGAVNDVLDGLIPDDVRQDLETTSQQRASRSRSQVSSPQSRGPFTGPRNPQGSSSLGLPRPTAQTIPRPENIVDSDDDDSFADYVGRGPVRSTSLRSRVSQSGSQPRRSTSKRSVSGKRQGESVERVQQVVVVRSASQPLAKKKPAPTAPSKRADSHPVAPQGASHVATKLSPMQTHNYGHVLATKICAATGHGAPHVVQLADVSGQSPLGGGVWATNTGRDRDGASCVLQVSNRILKLSSEERVEDGERDEVYSDLRLVIATDQIRPSSVIGMCDVACSSHPSSGFVPVIKSRSVFGATSKTAMKGACLIDEITIKGHLVGPFVKVTFRSRAMAPGAEAVPETLRVGLVSLIKSPTVTKKIIPLPREAVEKSDEDFSFHFEDEPTKIQNPPSNPSGELATNNLQTSVDAPQPSPTKPQPTARKHRIQDIDPPGEPNVSSPSPARMVTEEPSLFLSPASQVSDLSSVITCKDQLDTNTIEELVKKADADDTRKLMMLLRQRAAEQRHAIQSLDSCTEEEEDDEFAPSPSPQKVPAHDVVAPTSSSAKSSKSTSAQLPPTSCNVSSVLGAPSGVESIQHSRNASEEFSEVNDDVTDSFRAAERAVEEEQLRGANFTQQPMEKPSTSPEASNPENKAIPSIYAMAPRTKPIATRQPGTSKLAVLEEELQTNKAPPSEEGLPSAQQQSEDSAASPTRQLLLANARRRMQEKRAVAQETERLTERLRQLEATSSMFRRDGMRCDGKQPATNESSLSTLMKSHIQPKINSDNRKVSTKLRGASSVSFAQFQAHWSALLPVDNAVFLDKAFSTLSRVDSNTLAFHPYAELDDVRAFAFNMPQHVLVSTSVRLAYSSADASGADCQFEDLISQFVAQQLVSQDSFHIAPLAKGRGCAALSVSTSQTHQSSSFQPTKILLLFDAEPAQVVRYLKPFIMENSSWIALTCWIDMHQRQFEHLLPQMVEIASSSHANAGLPDTSTATAASAGDDHSSSDGSVAYFTDLTPGHPLLPLIPQANFSVSKSEAHQNILIPHICWSGFEFYGRLEMKGSFDNPAINPDKSLGLMRLFIRAHKPSVAVWQRPAGTNSSLRIILSHDNILQNLRPATLHLPFDGIIVTEEDMLVLASILPTHEFGAVKKKTVVVKPSSNKPGDLADLMVDVLRIGLSKRWKTIATTMFSTPRKRPLAEKQAEEDRMMDAAFCWGYPFPERIVGFYQSRGQFSNTTLDHFTFTQDLSLALDEL